MYVAERRGLTANTSVSDGFGVSLRARLGLALVVAVLVSRPRAPRPRPWHAPRRASPVPATMRCARRSSATCTSHTRFSADAYIYGTRAEPRDAYAFARARPSPCRDADEAQTRTGAPRPPARLRRRHRPRRVLRRGRPLRDAGLACLRHRHLPASSAPRETPQTAVPHHRPVALPRRHRQPAAVAAVLHRARRRLRRRRGVGLAGDPGRRRGGLRPHRRVHASPASSATSTRRARSAATCTATSSSATTTCRRSPTASSRPRPDGVPQGVWTAIERRLPGRRHRLRRGHHPAQLEPQRRPAVRGSGRRRRRRSAARTASRWSRSTRCKGNSECRFDRLAARASAPTTSCAPSSSSRSRTRGPDNSRRRRSTTYPSRNMVRNTLEGRPALRADARASTRSSSASSAAPTRTTPTPGNTERGRAATGAHGANDASPARLIADEVRRQPGRPGRGVGGGELARRDLRRRCAAARPTPPAARGRWCASSPASSHGVALRRARLRRARLRDRHADGRRARRRARRRAARASRAGREGSRAPPTRPGTDLQRIQIVKGWVDAAGATHERVFDVAGDADNGAGVDPATCAPRGAGARELCTVWEDPDFDPTAARLLLRARPREPDLPLEHARLQGGRRRSVLGRLRARRPPPPAAPSPTAASRDATDAFLSPTVQERAWTSPVWYRPEGIARVRGRMTFRSGAADGTLSLRIWIGTLDRARPRHPRSHRCASRTPVRSSP